MTNKLRFEVKDPRKQLTGDALILLEQLQDGENVRYKLAREIMACFAVDAFGRAMPYDKFCKLYGRLSQADIDAEQSALLEKINEAAVPKASASPSETP